ncbi:MAG: hypothetical protein RMJ19_12685 [Gemmatales bacterium]|nr:hypothetical protein [Gemmatales bacterium]MDW8176523.1 hypothetical protein [Gemmatales bacterium]
MRNRRLRKNGSWLDGVRVVMAAVLGTVWFAFQMSSQAPAKEDLQTPLHDREISYVCTWTVRLDDTELSSDRQTAIVRAEEKARQQLASWLRELWPDSTWSPTLDELRRLGIIYDWYAEARQLDLPDGSHTLFVGIAKCRLTPESWRALLSQARLNQRSLRLRMLGIYLLLPVSLLAAAAYWLLRPQ